MFRVFSSIGSIEGSKQWLESQGFKKISIDKISVSGLNGREISATSIDALWYTNMCGTKFRNSVYGELWQRFNTHALWATVWITPDGEVNNTGVGFNSE